MLLTRVNITTLILALLLFSPFAQSGGTVQPAVEVEIFKFQFLPQEITVNVGDTVRWTNKEKRQYHSVWFEQSGDPEPDYFFPGETYLRLFDQAGSFPYRCGPHPEMTGIVHVK
jgi:plastocyanin